MRKVILSVIFIVSVLSATAQEKGWYFSAQGSLGVNKFQYSLDNDNNSLPLLGFGGNLGVQYFFTKNWGVASGIGIAFYNSKAIYSNSPQNDPKHYLFEEMHDDDVHNSGNVNQNFSLLLNLNNWTETQQAYFLEIPLMLMYQTKWGTSESWGMYFGIGAKIQTPVISQKYTVKDGSQLSVSGYYQASDMTFPDPYGPDVSRHGYGTNTKTGFNGNIDLKSSIAGTGEIGFLKTLGRRLELMLSAYLDYGFNNIKNGNKTPENYLVNPEGNTKNIHPSHYVGDNLQYNGYINSHAINDDVNLLAIGGKVGLRIKLGKLNKIELPKEKRVIEEVTEKKYPYNILILDSLTQQPILTQVNIDCKDCPKQDNHNLYSSEKETVLLDLYPANTYNVTIKKSVFPVYNTQFTTSYEKKNVTLLVPLHPQIKGIVKNGKNNLLPDVDIQIVNSNAKQYNTHTNTEGAFMIPLVEAGAEYNIVASKTGYGTETIKLEIPASPDKLLPSYLVTMQNDSNIQLRPVDKIVLSVLVLFELGKSDLHPEAKREIKAIIQMLNENSHIQVVVEGHTDAQGSASYNKTLSQKRANSVRDYMIEQGIAHYRIKANGYGFSRLLNKCKPNVKCTEDQHQENRRVEFIFTEK